MSSTTPAERTAAADADRRTRRVALEEWRRPLLVEAGAGSGKTAVLVARLVSWMLGPGWEQARRPLGSTDDDHTAVAVLSGVVAITFTEAAAAEMAERVRRALVEIGDGSLPLGMDGASLPAAAVARGRTLLQHIDRLAVSTIHAFARRLLAERPLEAGLHPRWSIDADGHEWGRHIERATAEVVELGWKLEDPDLQRLAAAGIGPRELSEACRLLALDALAPAAVELAAEQGLEDLLEALRLALSEVVRLARGPLSRAPRTRIRAAGDLLFVLAELDAELVRGIEGGEVLGRVTVVGASARRRLREWSHGRFSKAEAAAFDGIEEPLAAACSALDLLLGFVGRLDLDGFRAACRVVARVLGRAEAAAERAGLLRFGDLVPRARRLLASSPAAAETIRGRITQLLVDEVQDTDSEQLELIAALALTGPVERRPGLFLVGDPKQSIYGWRSADLVAYDELGRRVEDSGGEVLRLVASFRSVPPVLEVVERLVGPRMERKPGLQPRFEPLLPQRDGLERPLPPGRTEVERWRVATGTSSSRATRLEARALATEIAELVRHGVSPEAVAVLVRTTTDLPIYLAALRDRDIPYAVARERDWRRRREVIEAGAALRVVLDPADAIAIVAVLRSPLVGVPDWALEPLWWGGLPSLVAALGGDDDTPIVARLVELGAALDPPSQVDSAGDWAFALGRWAGVVGELRRTLELEPSDTWIETVREALALEVLEASRPLGRWRVATLDRLFSWLRAQLTDGRAPIEVAALLRRGAGGDEDEGAAGAHLVPGAVRVLTIHAAKGLDFDHVFLAQVHKEPATRSRPRATRVVRDASGRSHVVLFGWPAPSAFRGETTAASVAAAEQVRLLYVGLTRARERLVVLGRPVSSAGEVSRGGAPPRSFAALLAGDPIETKTEDPLVLLREIEEEPGSVGCMPEVVGSRGLEVLLARRARRAAAAEHSDRPMIASPSFGSLEDERSPGEAIGDVLGLETLDPELARAVGSAFHRVLELVEIEALVAKTGAGRSGAGTSAAGAVRRCAAVIARGSTSEARAELELVVEQFLGGPLWSRFVSLAPRVLARELAFLAPPESDRGPVGAVTGVIDLLARDAEGRLLVVDYKTDHLAAADEGSRPAEAYREQALAYARAVALALDLPQPPRVELWFVRSGRIVGVGDWT